MYRKTLNLPHTTFTVSKKSTVQLKDELIIKTKNLKNNWNKLKRSENLQNFILHDGPPYANGPLHMGHAFNKIFKDVVLRSEYLGGSNVKYIPGWDCHGMPIEQKVIDKFGKGINTRKEAYNYALEAKNNQAEAMNHLGCVYNFTKNENYLTMSENYKIESIGAFYKLLKSEHVSQKYMPVLWSPSMQSALSDAELVYKDNHTSKAVYVAFKMNNMARNLSKFDQRCIISSNKPYPVHFVIWSTTLWTLYNNEAILFNKNLNYTLVENEQVKMSFIVATLLLDDFSKNFGNLKKITSFSGEKLKDLKYHSIFFENDYKLLPLLHSDHVNVEKGTGMVHASPNHGVEDFQVFLKHKIDYQECGVDGEGIFNKFANHQLKGLNIFDEKVGEIFSKILGHKLLKMSDFKHKYPYDWRTNKPVIFRNCRQWFFDVVGMKKETLNCLDELKIIPNSFKDNLEKAVKEKSYWCISRQRAWGNPIAIYYNQHGESVMDDDVNFNILKQLQRDGVCSWWSDDFSKKLSKNNVAKWNILHRKETDVFDVWMDSALSNFVVNRGKTVDLFVEGIDQIGAFFIKSMYLNLALTNKPPTKSIYVHGFVVDDSGQKMSKSLGNVKSPCSITKGEGLNSESFGIDVLRYWSIINCKNLKMQLSTSKLKNCMDKVTKIGNCLKFMLACMDQVPEYFDYYNDTVNFKKIDHFDFPNLYILHNLDKMTKVAKNSYKEMEFNHVLSNVDLFISNHLTLYFLTIKDVIYCDIVDSQRRLYTQLTLLIVLKKLIILLAPILPLLTEQVDSELCKMANLCNFEKSSKFDDKNSLFLKTDFYKINTNEILFQIFKNDSEIESFVRKCDFLMLVRNVVFSKIKSGNSKKYSVYLWSENDILENCRNQELTNFLQIASIDMLNGEDFSKVSSGQKYESFDYNGKCRLFLKESKNFQCPRCRLFNTPDENPCERCNEAIISIQNLLQTSRV